MFDNDVIVFISRIINSGECDLDIKNNLTKFYEYLVLTKMCDNDTLSRVSKIIECLDEILVIKKAFGGVDINNLTNYTGESIMEVNHDRHFDHYEQSYKSPRVYRSSC